MLERGDSKKGHKKGSSMRKGFVELSYSVCLRKGKRSYNLFRQISIYMRKSARLGVTFTEELMGKREEEKFNRVAICCQHCLVVPICFFCDIGATPTHFPFFPGKMAQILQHCSSILKTASYQDSVARSWTLPDKLRLEIGQNFPEIRYLTAGMICQGKCTGSWNEIKCLSKQAVIQLERTALCPVYAEDQSEKILGFLSLLQSMKSTPDVYRHFSSWSCWLCSNACSRADSRQDVALLYLLLVKFDSYREEGNGSLAKTQKCISSLLFSNTNQPGS